MNFNIATQLGATGSEIIKFKGGIYVKVVFKITPPENQDQLSPDLQTSINESIQFKSSPKIELRESYAPERKFGQPVSPKDHPLLNQVSQFTFNDANEQLKKQVSQLESQIKD